MILQLFTIKEIISKSSIYISNIHLLLCRWLKLFRESRRNSSFWTFSIFRQIPALKRAERLGLRFQFLSFPLVVFDPRRMCQSCEICLFPPPCVTRRDRIFATKSCVNYQAFSPYILTYISIFTYTYFNYTIAL